MADASRCGKSAIRQDGQPAMPSPGRADEGVIRNCDSDVGHVETRSAGSASTDTIPDWRGVSLGISDGTFTPFPHCGHRSLSQFLPRYRSIRNGSRYIPMSVVWHLQHTTVRRSETERLSPLAIPWARGRIRPSSLRRAKARPSDRSLGESKGSGLIVWVPIVASNRGWPRGRKVDCKPSRSELDSVQEGAPNGLPRCTDFRTDSYSSSVRGSLARSSQPGDGPGGKQLRIRLRLPQRAPQRSPPPIFRTRDQNQTGHLFVGIINKES
jgi:hypothetical protein